MSLEWVQKEREFVCVFARETGRSPVEAHAKTIIYWE